ncbi:agmatinase [Roseixanthobacter glucoisosaccharinicivorans]|uniref:agmatinase n=1 Tax=Roseixanthobacter glucoisosaccharinicivorans TaxID=3119923 RepID=UPI00372CDF8A
MTDRTRHIPLSGNDMPRFGGIATMMRLPHIADAAQLDAGFIGVPLDVGTSNRAGTRFGPRQIRTESVFVRPYNTATRAAPFDSLAIADLGDVATNPYSLERSVELIEAHFAGIFATGCRPMALGGDHTMTLPILRAAAKTHGPVALVHVDAHADVNDTMFGERIAHGTPMRRALEEGLIDPRCMVQVGLRGSGYAADDFDWQRGLGVWVVPAERCWHRSLVDLAREIRTRFMGRPTYISFDIDSLDPSIAPGTGTIEPAGLTLPQALELIRGLHGLDIVGFDLVEVSPPYDTTGNTALIGANLLFEMLCILPGVAYRDARHPLSFRPDLPPDWV